MKKMLFIIIVLLIVTSCAGTNDWSYDLPNGFEVWHINSKEIKVVYLGDDLGLEIPSFVKEFTYDSQYVFTRNVDDIGVNNIFDEKFYILDTKNKILYGPYNKVDDFINELKNLQIDFPTHWYRTSSDPNIIDSTERNKTGEGSLY